MRRDDLEIQPGDSPEGVRPGSEAEVPAQQQELKERQRNEGVPPARRCETRAAILLELSNSDSRMPSVDISLEAGDGQEYAASSEDSAL